MAALPSFSDLFARPASVRADAPGRVNLIGEHTDYNGGFVLPAVIPQRTRVALAPRTDLLVRVWSANVAEADRLGEFVLGSERPTRTWVDYVAGVAVALRKGGHTLKGFDARIDSDVPVGAGLSSSAALEVSIAAALRAAFHLRLDDVELARAGRSAENEFVGVPTGVMDQMAAALGEAGSALFLDTRSLVYEHVPLPAGAELVVIDSGVKHAHASGEYAVRRRQCEEACRLLGVSQLRDLTLADLPRVQALSDPIGRRARHVVTEDDRVLQAVAAMRAGDVRRLGDLFRASHQSMRDDFQVSVPQVDRLVEIAALDPDVFGARLTGGGFGGAVVILASAGAGAAAGARIAARYAADTRETPTVLVP